MRVAVDARYLENPDVGISIYIRGLVKRLIDSGIDVALLTDGVENARALSAEFGATGVALRCHSGFAWEQIALPRWLWRNRPEAVIAPANYGLPLIPVPGVRRIAVIHDLIPLRLPHLYLRRGPVWWGKYLLSIGITLRAADAIFSVSQTSARDVRRLSRCRVWVRMPDLPDVTQASEIRTSPRGWPRRYFLYNGGRDPRKNVPRLIAAFARYRRLGGDHHLVLIGRGYDEYSPLIRRLGIENEVNMPGFVDEQEKVLAIAGAGAVIYPSRWEGFGLPVVEGFAAGVPVVSGRGGALDEIGGSAVLFVDVDNIDSIADGMLNAVQPSVRERARVDGPRRLADLAGESRQDMLLAYLRTISRSL